MSTFEATLEQLPKPILDKLQSIIWRVRRLLFVRGIFATIAIGLLSLLAIMAIDASVTIFSPTVRWGLSILGLAVTALAGWWFLIRPLSRKLSLTHVARILEVRHPELQERISTAVELLSSDDPEEIKGSEELIKAVVDSAVLDVENVDPRREFKGGRAAKFIKLAALCLAILASVLLVFPNHGWKLLARAVAPFSNIGNAYADTMIITPGNTRISKGNELSITLEIKADKLRRAELRRTLADGSESVERMTLMGKTDDGAQKFSITFPSVQEDFTYRVRAGAGLSKYYKVEAVPPPIIEKRTIRYDYPEYTQLESVEADSLSGEIKAVANTQVTITSVVNKEVWKAKTILNDAGELGNTEVDDNIVTTTFALKNSTSGTWRLDLEDMDEFANERSPFPIQALPDRAPVVRVTNPLARELRLKPVEVLPMNFEISEDFGFREVAILVTPNDEANPRVIIQPTPTAGNQRGMWNGLASLNLASLDLKPNQNRLQVQIRALDNRPETYDGPGEGISETITVLIDRNAKSLAEQTIEAQKRELTQAIRDARNDLERAKNDMRNAERELQRRDEISQSAERDLERFRDEAKEAEETLKDVAEKLENSVFKPQAEALGEIAEEEITAARESADLIPVTDEKKERVQEARDAREEIENAIAELKEVEESIRDSEDDIEAIAQLNEMANDQRELAQDAARKAEELEQQQNQANNERQQQEMERREQQAMNEFQKRQDRVQEELGEMLKDNAAALEEILEKQKEESNQLADKASELAKKQDDLRDMTLDAATSRTDPDQQKALEEEIVKQLQKMQQQIAKETSEVQQEMAQSQSQPSENNEQSQAQSQDQQEQSQQAENQQSSEANESTPADPQESLQQAAEQTQSAAESLAQEQIESAKEAAQEASEALAEAAAAQQQSAAQAAAEPSASQPEPGQPESAQQAAAAEQNQAAAEQQATAEALSDLAERQEAVAEQLAAIESGDLQEALAMMEEQLTAETSELQAEAEALENTLENLDQRQSRYEAGHASNFLNSAESQTKQAQQDLQQAQKAQDQAESSGQVQPGELARNAQQAMNRGQADQKAAQRSMETAARSLDKASDAIGQTLDGLKPSEQDERLADSGKMAESFDDLTESSQSQNAQQAADRSQQAAESLQQLAQQAMQQLGNMGQDPQGQGEGQQPSQQDSQNQQNQQMSEQQGEGMQPNEGTKMADADGSGIPPELQELGITAKDWARFKGALTGGSATAIDTNLPAEYRELVGRYFQVIAKEADGK